MVEAQTWLDENYPKETRDQITELNISNKGLEGVLNLTDFIQLLKFNISFNKLTDFYPEGINNESTKYFENNRIVEVDCSHNNFSGSWGTWRAGALTKLNFSNNNVDSSILIARNLAYLDASNNKLDKLDLSQASQALVDLKCSNNGLVSGLNLTRLPNLKHFDCLGVKFDSTVSTSHDNNLTIGLSAGLGITSFLLTIITIIFVRKWWFSFSNHSVQH